ncbi:TPA: TIGR00269 family protein [Candidatus Woesearchaeota archaeon]|nr:TIGR00269 family protein [Candidatus Woesearchaeota archaeon]
MRCAQCESTAVIDGPLRCEKHFLEGFEECVRRTIEEHDLIPSDGRIAVAVSGGKDSLVVLTLLHKWFGKERIGIGDGLDSVFGDDRVVAIAIDEGIDGYRDRTLDEARRVCAENNITLIVRSFEDLAGQRLDAIIKRKDAHPCSVCGTLRRRLLADASKGFAVIATGHNADDESQAILMNLIRGNTELFARLGPSTGTHDAGFTRRVKPLYFCPEREVMAYAYMKGFARGFEECPYAGQSYRQIVRDALNSYAQSHHGVRDRLLRRFLVAKSALSRGGAGAVIPCRTCGEPSSSGACKTCAILRVIGAGSDDGEKRA